MEKWLSEITPIMDVEHDCILSKQGDISIVFKAELPEIFTQSVENYEALHQSLIKAIKVLPKDSVFLKQDYFIQAKYKPDFEKSYLPQLYFLLYSSCPSFKCYFNQIYPRLPRSRGWKGRHACVACRYPAGKLNSPELESAY